ncbi:M1 family aminopeptidase [Pseudonocardia endophytica]|uniref:Peptidase M1-like protein n=1 Tax=Pseudonocardia endophytica TaxID=401976 RepID=A0A4R1HLS7_PSEEN|nr:M1 family aminopeptidase [Pseudonocardia endophytica]TCK22948.1 peptidase M1-like protein [Pseudonocardia endophytica]
MIGTRVRGALVGVAALALTGCSAAVVAPTTAAGQAADAPGEWSQRPVVDASLDIAPDLATATGTETVTVTPDQPVCELVFRVWANRPSTVVGGTSSTVTGASVDGNPVAPRVDAAGAPPGAPGTLVTLPLAACARAGTPIRADLRFTLAIGRGDADERVGHATDTDTAWLGTPMPLLAWVRGEGWERDPAVRMGGESAVSEEFRLAALRVTAGTDQAVTGTGTETGTSSPAPGRTTHTYTAESVRDVAVAAGDFALTEATAGGTRVHVAVPRAGSIGSGQEWADETTRQLAALERLLGPYPYPDLWVTVASGQVSGIEFPTHVQFGDVGRVTRPSLVAHELSHQWFYSLVGNDQSRDPWLDESFATFAEATVAGERDTYRLRAPGDPDVVGPIGAPMAFWDARGGFSAYSVGVYEQGAAALLEGRDRVGPERFDAALRAYIGANAHRVAHPSDVEAAFRDLPQVLDVLHERGAFRTS